MKNISKILLGTVAFVGSLATVGCSDLLDSTNIYEKDMESFYNSKADMDQALNGVYNSLFVSNAMSEMHITSSIQSDLMLAGGGADDSVVANIDSFSPSREDTYFELWTETYKGVLRANAIIETIDGADLTADFTSTAEAEEYRANIRGEAYFMRGYLMFRAALFFGGMPLIPTVDSDRTVNRSSITETYAFIASDMLQAIENLPATNINNTPLSEYGHATLWAAKGYLARIYLYYTGYMTNIEGIATTTLPYNGGEISKGDVVTHLEDLMQNSGHDLVSDFRNLWPYSYVNKSNSIYNTSYDGTAILPWAETEGLDWAGQDGPNATLGTGNPEIVFTLRYGLGNWEYDSGTGQKYNNRSPLYLGIRENSMIPFGKGWGWCPIHPIFYKEWSDDDLRKAGSVLTLGDEAQGTGSWKAGQSSQETGLMNKKYTTLQHNGADGTQGMFYYIYNMSNGDAYQLWAAQDYYLMRYADVLLMHSELTEDATGLNRIRTRAGLDEVTYSLDALKKERMYELAFEGIRWYDLVRWGDVEGSNNYYGRTAEVSNMGVDATYSVTYRAETKGLLPIPETEIRLSNNLYEQNPGW
ncbi:MAG: RagB/SusD family nutrient uptake outer membrane protein [Rikenellaceae bacterium]